MTSWWQTIAVAVAMTAAVAAQDRGTVRVTAKRANIRAEASEKSKVLAQVTAGMDLELVGVEGEWLHVRVPVGGVRVEAYISKKVAKIVSAPAPPPSAVSVPPPSVPSVVGPARGLAPMPPPAQPPLTRNGIAVVMTVSGTEMPLAPTPLRIVQVPDKIDALAKASAIVPRSGGAAGEGGDTTFVWTADGPAATRTVADHRPSFLATFREIRGLNPDDFAPVLVRLTPAASGVRLVAALRGRADEAARTDADWDVVHDMRQDIVRTDVQKLDRGAMRITPVADLAPGEYAVVLRLAAKRKVAGAMLLGSDGEGQAFSLCWDFEVR